MRVTEIHVDRYGPLRRTTVEPGPGLHVLYGPNEAGKTLFLEALLRLVEPEITKAMPPVERVEDAPAGYVRAVRDGEEVHRDGAESLFAGTDVSPAHLANIFVVRESDLSLLSDEHSFYSSLTEHIGVLHTTALDRIEEELILRGRLTKKERRLSSAEDRDEAAEVRERARSLEEEIDEYVEEAEDEGLDELEGRLVATRSELESVRREVEALDRAEALDRHDTLRRRLEAYRDAAASLEELEAVDRESLQELVSARDARETERERVSGLREEIRGHEERLAELQGRIDEKRDELSPLAEREADVERLAARLGEVSPEGRTGSRAQDAERTALWTGAGLLAAGALVQTVSLFLGLGLDAVALTLVLLGALGLAGYVLLRGRRRGREEEERRLADEAARAGLDAEEPREIAASIRTYRSTVRGLRERIDELEKEADARRSQIDTLRAQVEESRETIAGQEATTGAILEEAGLESVDQYRGRVEEKEELDRRRETARQSLADALGEPPGGDWTEKAEAWERELGDLVEGIRREEAAPGEYDPDEHAAKREELERLEQRRDDLAGRLGDHRGRIERFERRAREEVDATPFLASPVELEARTVEGLRRLARRLGDLVERIDRDAEVSRLALEVLDELRAEEERKITDLFGDEGPATETFRRMADGRYRRVRYDPDERTLIVAEEGGGELRPRQLSKGTRDQLYLSARVGLAHRLLGEDRGFFVLDDPLVAADPDRLTAAFRVLVSLAEEGWQVLYVTAKEEVRDRIVGEFSLPLTTFDNRL